MRPTLILLLIALAPWRTETCDNKRWLGTAISIVSQPIPLPAVPGVISTLISDFWPNDCTNQEEIKKLIDEREVARLNLKLQGFNETLNQIKRYGEERDVNAIR